MSWIEMATKTEGVRAIFTEGVPPLRNVDVHEVRLDRDGPTVFIRFDLEGFPVNPPVKWESSRINTVQVKLALWGIRSLSVNGGETEMIADIDLESVDDGFVRVCIGPIPRLEIVTRGVYVDRVSAYINSDRPPGRSDQSSNS